MYGTAMQQVLPVRRPLLSNAVLGTLLFVGAELMFFGGLISAFTIVKASIAVNLWPPPWQPKLPFAQTAFNSLALFLSAGALLASNLQYRKDAKRGGTWLLAAFLLGATFVALQGVEWAALIRQGLTLGSTPYASFFYFIVGAHALHAVGALFFLAAAWVKHGAGTLGSGFFFGTQTFWYFVVAIWPLIFFRVYS